MVSALEAMWDQGKRPDVSAFLTKRGGRQLELDAPARRVARGPTPPMAGRRKDRCAVVPPRFPRRRAATPRLSSRSYTTRSSSARNWANGPTRATTREPSPSSPNGSGSRWRSTRRCRTSTSPEPRHDWPQANGVTGEDGAAPVVPGYELLGEIGRGGMGIVYRARQLKPNRLVALKMILEGRFATPNDVLRFENEAEAIAALDHPNVVPILEVGQSERLHYFTMPLLTGGSLAGGATPPGRRSPGRRQGHGRDRRRGPSRPPARAFSTAT